MTKIKNSDLPPNVPGNGPVRWSMAGYCLAAYTAFMTMAALVPNVDSFMSVRMGFQTLLSGAGVVAPEVIAKFYYLLIPMLVAPLAVAAYLADLRDWTRNSTIIGGAGVAAYMVFGFLRAGEGIYFAVRQNEVVNILLLSCSIAIGSVVWRWSWLRVGVVAGLTAAVAAKLVDSAYIYSQGGVILVGDGISMQVDGGALMLLGLSALLLAVAMFHAMERRKYVQSVIFVLVLLGTVAALVSGFRRLAVLRFLIALVGWVGLIWWARGRKLTLLVGMGLGLILTAFLMYIPGLLLFGEARLNERVISVFAKGGTEFSASNSLYLSDWHSFGQVWPRAGLIGTGTSMNYNISRETDMLFGAEFVPLHTGGYELMISCGLVGTLFLFWGLARGYWTGARVLLYRIRSGQGTARAGMETILVLVLYAVVVVFFPFASPFYFSPQACLVVGFALGVCITRRLTQQSVTRR